MTWTEENREAVKKLWAEGFSGSQIAGEIGGVSRSAILGFVYRSKLPGRERRPPKPARRTRQQAGSERQTQMRMRRAPPLAEHTSESDFKPVIFVPRKLRDVPDPLHLSIYELTKCTCKWPFGDRAPFTFCGHPPEPGLPFCEAHCGIAYNVPLRRGGVRPC